MVVVCIKFHLAYKSSCLRNGAKHTDLTLLMPTIMLMTPSESDPNKYVRMHHRKLCSTKWKPMQCLIRVFVCVEVLRPSQPNEVMSSAVSLPNHTFTGQALSPLCG